MANNLQIGEIFDDKYELLEVLGSGGVGTVYKCLQLDCQRTVALKVLHFQAACDPEYQARFMREGRALSKLSHANIVSVYHMGISAAGLPYIAMEYLAGQSVRQVLNSCERMNVRRSFKIISDAAKALSHVHQSGLVHRDLKPENMLLVDKPEPDTVKLLDFGFARFSEAQEQKLTHTGEIMGTTAYMSPEQCAGKPVDFRSDIYSLTSCLYEMMTGGKPFVADSGVGMMYKHLNEAVPEIRPAQVDLFHPVLNAIVSRGMAKDPQNRFSSMDDMASTLEAALPELESGNSRRILGRKPVIAFLLPLLLLSTIAFLYCKMPKSKPMHSSLNLAAGESSDDIFKRLQPAAQIRMLRGPRMHSLGEAQVDLALSSKRLSNAQRCELLFIHTQYTTDPDERIKFLCKGLYLARNDASLPDYVKQELLNTLFLILNSSGLYHQALETDAELQEQVKKHGLPAYSTEDDYVYKFSTPDLLFEKMQAAHIFLLFGNNNPFKKELSQLLENDSLPMSGPWALAMEGSLKLGLLDQSAALIRACPSAEMCCAMSDVCRKFHKLGLAKDCIDQSQGKIRIAVSRAVVSESAKIALAEAYLLCEKGKKKQALAVLENFSKNDLENMDRLARPYYTGKLAQALLICGDTNAGCRLLSADTTKDNVKSPYAQVIQKLASDNVSEPIRLAAISLFAAPSASVEQRCLLALQLRRRGDAAWTAAAANLAMSEQGKQLSRSLRLLCLYEYIPMLINEGLPAEALRLSDLVLEDLRKNGLPEGSTFKFGSREELKIRLFKANILSGWGQSRIACQQVDEIKKYLPKENLPWIHMLESELELQRLPEAELLARECNDPLTLIEMAKSWCRRDKFKEAMLCLDLAKAHDTGSFTALIDKEQAVLLLEQGKIKEAQQLLLTLCQRNEIRKDTAFCKSLASALALAHLDKQADEVSVSSRGQQMRLTK